MHAKGCYRVSMLNNRPVRHVIIRASAIGLTINIYRTCDYALQHQLVVLQLYELYLRVGSFYVVILWYVIIKTLIMNHLIALAVFKCLFIIRRIFIINELFTMALPGRYFSSNFRNNFSVILASNTPATEMIVYGK